MGPQDPVADEAQRLFDWLGANSTEQARCLALSLCGGNDSPGPSLPQRGDSFDWLGPVSRADQLSLAPPHPAVVVLVDDDVIDAKHAAGVIGRLRDMAGGRVLIAGDMSAVLSERELLALGYERREHPALAVELYLHDPNDFFSAREWNNAECWANPQNYDRYRW